MLDKRRTKKAAQNGEPSGKDSGGVTAASAASGGDLKGAEKAKRTYKQRQAVDREGMKEKGMESVLGSVFG